MDNEEIKGALKSYDVTVPWSEKLTPKEVGRCLAELASKFAYQLEISESKYKHYQIRLRLFKKKILSMAIEQIHKVGLKGAHVSRTVGVNSKKFDYVMKSDTRVEGPWTDETWSELEEVDEELMTNVLYPWQKDLKEYIENGPTSRRGVDVYVDLLGGLGKTFMMKYLRWKKLACVIPPFSKMEDVIQMVMCKPTAKCYVIDIPRGLGDKKMQEFWSGIEQIKNGYCYDKRHKFRDRMFKTPKVVVFTNTMPDVDDDRLLTKDRWNITRIQPITGLLAQTPAFGNVRS